MLDLGDAMLAQEENNPSCYEGHDLEALADLPHYVGWILQGFAEHLRGRVLEVGAGTGNFSARYVDAVDEAVLLEPAQNLYPTLATRFAGKNHVKPVSGLLEDWANRVAAQGGSDGRPFDAAVMVNVLEHIADDHGTIRRLGTMLRPGGKLLIFVPALRWLYGSLDAQVHHYRRYSRSALTRVVERAGLEMVSLHYFDVAGVLPWLIAGRVLKQRAFSARAAHIYDRIIVPLSARLERWLRLPLGKNLICVAQRPTVAVSGILRAA
jgi:SAM-dependent methyltransferase